MNMNKLSWLVVGVVVVLAVVIGMAIPLMQTAAALTASSKKTEPAGGLISDAKLLRVPVTGIYPGGTTAGLLPDLQNPLANDPNAVERGMKNFALFNCSGCHMANGGGGMGPALSNNKWLYRKSAANLYLDIAQGRGNGMPAWGAMLPDKTIWELVAYIQSISNKPTTTFGTTTSASPPNPDTEQVPAEQLQTVTPWKFTQPRAPNGERPGGAPPTEAGK